MPTNQMRVTVSVWNPSEMKYDTKHSDDYEAERFQLSEFRTVRPYEGEVLVRITRGRIESVAASAYHATVFLSAAGRFEVVQYEAPVRPQVEERAQEAESA